MKPVMKVMTAVLLLGATIAHAELYEFGFNAALEPEEDTITNQYAHAIGEDQFRMVVDIANPTNGVATFSFYNIGGAESVLTTARFDEGSGMGLTLNSIANSPAPDYVNFTEMGNPNLPPANGIDPAFVAEIGVAAMESEFYSLFDAGVLNGAAYDSAEKVTLAMSYTPGVNILDMLTTGELRVVTKIQGVWYPGDDMSDPTLEISEYFVNDTGYEVIPEPASAVLLVGASSLIGIIRRRFIS